MSGKKTLVPWEALYKALEIRFQTPAEDALLARALEQADRWTADFEKENGLELEDAERHEVATAVVDMLHEHWSAASIISVHLNIDELVETTNRWCRQPAPCIRKLPTGDGIVDWRDSTEGVWLGLEEPFLCAYTAARKAYGQLDDKLVMRDVTGEHVAWVMRTIYRSEDKLPVLIDLADWDDERDPPTWPAIERMVADRRRRESEARQAGTTEAPRELYRSPDGVQDATHVEPQDDHVATDVGAGTRSLRPGARANRSRANAS